MPRGIWSGIERCRSGAFVVVVVDLCHCRRRRWRRARRQGRQQRPRRRRRRRLPFVVFALAVAVALALLPQGIRRRRRREGRRKELVPRRGRRGRRRSRRPRRRRRAIRRKQQPGPAAAAPAASLLVSVVARQPPRLGVAAGGRERDGGPCRGRPAADGDQDGRARRAVQQGDPGMAIALLRAAAGSSIRPLVEEPLRSLVTLVAALVSRTLGPDRFAQIARRIVGGRLVA